MLNEVLICPECEATFTANELTSQRTYKIRDGEVVLYRRDLSSKWQARFKLPNSGWHRISTKRSNLTEAKRVAGEAYDKARFRAAEGLNAISKRFSDVAKQSVALMEKALANGTGKVAYKDYINATEKYLIPFFKSRHVDNIDENVLQQFNAWRIEQMGKEPAASTLANHNAAMNRIFDLAVQDGLATRKNIPVLQKNGRKSKRRPDFTSEEWRSLRANLRHWVQKAQQPRSLMMRELLWDYVLILANTGIRAGTEAANLKWKHLSWHHDKAGRHLTLSVNGKTGERRAVARHNCEEYFKRIQLRFPSLSGMSFDELLKAKVDEYVFRLSDGRRTKNLNHTFRDFLLDVGLLEDEHGNERTLYSLRHTYATLRLVEDKTPIHNLAAPPMATSNSPTYGRPNSPGQDALIIS
ncbi:MAG: site-specific integrase [Rhodocyclaceae bacterium]|nr:site-specific integrase [Rhodocyclaceae bacterium]